MTIDLLDEVQRVRSDNNRLWIDVLRVAMEAAPERAKVILSNINENDRKISMLLAKVVSS